MAEGSVKQEGSDGVQRQATVFRWALPLRVHLREAMRLVGDPSGLRCLDVGAPNVMLSHFLRKMGGEWATVAAPGANMGAFRAALGDSVHEFQSPLPFENKAFDVMVVFGGMEQAPSDLAMVEEFHRVLKPDARLVIRVDHCKSMSLIGSLRSLFGVSPEKLGYVRPGYTESQLFNALKNGFDVHVVRSYARFFISLVDSIVQGALRPRPADQPARDERSVYRVAATFYWIALQLDMLLLFSKGHSLIAQAKRRRWRSREAPVLVDGRSISEAVLSRAAK
jgi:SAM-dependent methyltransferase